MCLCVRVSVSAGVDLTGHLFMRQVRFFVFPLCFLFVHFIQFKTIRPSQRTHFFGAPEPFFKTQFPTFGDMGKQASRKMHGT